jgi:hypothetical protein
MRYLDVLWRGAPALEPVRLVSEVDDAGWELRKIEFFLDGRIGYAFGSCQFGGTDLSVEPLPPLAEINAQSEFVGKEMLSDAFETLWRQHVGHEAPDGGQCGHAV